MNEELKQIKADYYLAVKSGDSARVDEVVNFHLRAFLQTQYDQVSIAIKDTKDISGMEKSISPHEIQILRQKKQFLDNLVFNDSEWEKFSQQLKSGNPLGFL